MQWNITKVAGKEDQYLLQDDAQNRYLIPRDDGSTGTFLGDQVFEWKIVQAGDNDVNLYQSVFSSQVEENEQALITLHPTQNQRSQYGDASPIWNSICRST